jgi:glycogen debranching enzyme
MTSITPLDERFRIIADTERDTAPQRVLKHGNGFGVFDHLGDIVPAEAGEQGLYYDGTRFLSRLELLIAQRRPLLLSSTVSEDNTVFTADLTNPDIHRDAEPVVSRGDIHLFRSRVLWEGCCVERVRVANHGLVPVEFPLAVRFDSDFVDLFEVRGTRRARRGAIGPPTRVESACVLRYQGLDGVERRTRVLWSRSPDHLEPGVVSFTIRLDRHAATYIDFRVECEVGANARDPYSYDDIRQMAQARVSAHAGRGGTITSSNETFNRWIRRSTADLHMMLTHTPRGVYPYAGIPWFSAPFGRDGIITALELLWADPEIARGVLTFLADTQATEFSDAQDAQPGKILHEMRGGEMAALAEVPFGRYYGTADATPLFVMLAHAYIRRTRDGDFLERIWPNILAALDWMRTSGDPDGDGFIEYTRSSPNGLLQQGWKDSSDSVFHADGTLAVGPIALCEVQAYAYAAWAGAADLAAGRGADRQAAEWRRLADTLRTRFDEIFWCDEIGTYALALDGDKRPCRVRTSNAGHCLFTGIARMDRAARVAATLMEDSSFAGWGVRTVASGEPRYNPMSYHNGSIWPHDNALVAAGLSRYGFTAAATRILSAMLDLSQSVDLHRLPELICGFHRRGGEFPTLYPVACAPQSWSAGAVYLLVEACLGLEVDAAARRLSFHRAVLPDAIDWLGISRLRIGDGSVDLRLDRHRHDVGVEVVRREGDIEIVAVK